MTIKFNWIVFHYDFNKLKELRSDFDSHDVEITFKYTCASIKTFINHNPKLINDIFLWTDDKSLLIKTLKQNNVFIKTDNIFDIKSEIEEDMKNPNPWHVKTSFMLRHMKNDSFFIDNDCICKASIDTLIEKLSNKSIILWEKERQIFNSRPYWGWQMAAKHLNVPFHYWVANEGIIGLTSSSLVSKQIMNKTVIMMNDLYSNIDISSVYPDRHPRLMIASQISLCFVAQDLGLEIIESKEYFDHFYSDKKQCLKYL